MQIVASFARCLKYLEHLFCLEFLLICLRLFFSLNPVNVWSIPNVHLFEISSFVQNCFLVHPLELCKTVCSVVFSTCAWSVSNSQDMFPTASISCSSWTSSTNKTIPYTTIYYVGINLSCLTIILCEPCPENVILYFTKCW